MEWWNILCPSLRRHPIVTSSPTQQGTWMMLMGYCIGQENGGVIESCRRWSRNQWRQTAAVEKAVIDAECALWSWENDDLAIFDYPLEVERSLKQRRAAGQSGGRARSESKAAAARDNGRGFKEIVGPPEGDDESEPQAEPKRTPSEGEANPKRKPTKDKIREDKRREDKEREGDGAPAPDDSLADEVEEQGLSGLPENESDAEFAGNAVGCPPDFARFIWHKAASRGGRDAKGITIRNWPAYLAMEWAYENRRLGGVVTAPARTAAQAPAKPVPVWQQIKSLETMIDEVDRDLRMLPRFNPDVFPDEFRAAEAKRAPLLEKKKSLQARIKQLNAACAGTAPETRDH